ncbi:MAG: glycosyltransferase, partial [Alphaproteobacteria bacterium]
LCATPRDGTTASVVSLAPGGTNRRRLQRAGLEVSDLGMLRPWPSVAAVTDLARRVRAIRPDVVQSWMYHADLMALAALRLVRRRHRPPLVWGVRCSDMDARQYGLRFRLLVGFCSRLSRLPSAVVANSYAGRAVHQDLGFHPRRFEVIANGIDAAQFRPDAQARAEARAELGMAQDAIVLAHVARVDPMKDHATFLAALERLPRVVALAIGKDTERLPALPNLLRLGQRGDMPRLLAASDIAVSSSAFGEGFSNAIAEGMAAGLPVVATDVGDARLIIAETGLVVPARDPERLAAAISRLAGEPPEALRARGTCARQRIEREFPLSRAAESFSHLYRELI